MAIEYSSVDEESPLQTVHIIGQTASSAAGGSVGAQAAEILERVDVLLSAEGTDKSELIQANIWLRDLRSFAEMNTVWERWVPPGITARRTTFEAHNLPPRCDLRVDIIAWRRSQEPTSS